MSTLIELTAAALLLGGTLVMTLAIAGTLRWSGLHMRNHAAGKSVLLGVVVLLAASIGTADAALIRRALLAGLVLLLTAPVSAHAIARAHHRESAADGTRDSHGDDE